jgi:hypothetical protein
VIEMLFGVLFGGKGWMWKTAGGFGGEGGSARLSKRKIVTP